MEETGACFGEPGSIQKPQKARHLPEPARQNNSGSSRKKKDGDRAPLFLARTTINRWLQPFEPNHTCDLVQTRAETAHQIDFGSNQISFWFEPCIEHMDVINLWTCSTYRDAQFMEILNLWNYSIFEGVFMLMSFSEHAFHR